MPFLKYILTVFGKKKPRIEVVRRESNGLRLQEWRSHSELVAMANALWGNEDFRLMMQIVQNECPGNFALLSGGLEDRAMHQARTEGYNLALANLKAMRVPVEKIQEIESTYEPEEEMT